MRVRASVFQYLILCLIPGLRAVFQFLIRNFRLLQGCVRKLALLPLQRHYNNVCRSQFFFLLSALQAVVSKCSALALADGSFNV